MSTDPYSPWERGSNENNNRFLRKEIIKGQAINAYRSKEIIAINRWLNNYPRQMFVERPIMALYEERQHQQLFKINWSVLFV